VEYSSKRVSGGRAVGYIRLTEFNAEAVPGLRQALVDLGAQGVDDVVLDLRGNTGGGFQFALNIGGMFMDGKPMATAIGRGNEQNVFKTSYPDGVLTDKPLIVLTDGLSASASEVRVRRALPWHRTCSPPGPLLTALLPLAAPSGPCRYSRGACTTTAGPWWPARRPSARGRSRPCLGWRTARG
jgi:hypothetical protein